VAEKQIDKGLNMPKRPIPVTDVPRMDDLMIRRRRTCSGVKLAMHGFVNMVLNRTRTQKMLCDWIVYDYKGGPLDVTNSIRR